MTPQQRIGAAAALCIAAAVGAIATLRPSPTAPTAVAPRPIPGSLPRDALSYVPASTRVLAVADLDALRRAPATRRWFTDPPGAENRCQAAIARKIRTVALAVPRLPMDDFGFVAAGDVSPDDLAACAPGAVAVEREGVRLLEVRSPRDGGVGGTLVWVPTGVVLVGSRAMVDAMLDRAFDAKRGRAAPLALDPLRRYAGAGAALWALALPSTERAPPGDPLGTVSGGALWANVGEGLTLDGTLLCDDSAHARRAADALTRVRNGALEELTAAPLRALLEGARAETDGASVRVRATLDAAAIAGAIDAVGGMLRGLAPYPSTSPRAP